MERYKNVNGNSGVAAYEHGKDYIRVQFNDDSVYLYNYASTGANDIEEMKKLAIAGKGLNTFISKVVKKRYAKKER